MGPRLAVGIVLLAACNARLGAPVGGSADAPAGPQDAPRMIDAHVVIPDAVQLGPWGTPSLVPGASSPTLAEDDCTMSSDTLELYFAVVDTTITGNPKDIFEQTRPSTTGMWSTPQKIAAIDTAATEESPRLSPDDKTLYFGRAGDIYQVTRAALGDAWNAASVAMVPTVSTSTSYEKWLAVCTGGYFLVARAGDLYEGQLGQVGTAAAELNSTANETSTYLSPDCLTTYFASARSGSTQIYTATRTAVDQPWTTPVEITDADDAGATTDNEDPWISPDLRTFVFASNRGGTEDVYITTR